MGEFHLMILIQTLWCRIPYNPIISGDGGGADTSGE